MTISTRNELSIKEANHIVGGLSRPSKMPGYAYGLPAEKCKTGSKLHYRKGTICSQCYALKGRYMFPNVQIAQERRIICLHDTRWVQAMVTLITKRNVEYFRWHDSGDLQGMWHLEKIIEVAHACPNTRFWLPTREYELVNRLSKALIPTNLAIRVSDVNIDGGATTISGFPTSGVTRDSTKATCPAPLQGGTCGQCRNCWNPNVRRVVYKYH